MAFKIWVGKRESDILTYNYFDASITFWGSNKNNNYSFCTVERIKDNYGNEFSQFVLKILLQYISRNSDVIIHFYNNMFAYKLIQLEPAIKKYVANINPKRIMDIVRHKTLSRVWLQNAIDVPQFTYLSKQECNYNVLLNAFPGHNKFVIQKSISGGGNGTYLVSKNNWENIFNVLDNNDVYLISPYYDNNISVSCHMIIDAYNVIVFPVSEQLLRYEENNISYCGNRYIYNGLSEDVKKAALVVGNRLKEIEYRGICGLDFICTNDKIMLIEINPRYQGSSYLINAELNRMHMPSLFELNNTSFKSYIDQQICDQIQKMNIQYESHTCVYNKKFKNSSIEFPSNVTLFLDGVDGAKKYQDNVYLYRYLNKNCG